MDWTDTQIDGFRIRNAVPRDVPLILKFIRELAEYEKLSHEVVADEQILRRNLFGDNRNAEVVLGYEQSRPAAFALFFHNFSTFLGKPGLYLEDLFVKPEFRGKGYGTMMLAFLAKLAVDRNCGRLEWWVLDWNKSAINFYKKIGAEPMDEWTVYRVAGKRLEQLSNRFESS